MKTYVERTADSMIVIKYTGLVLGVLIAYWALLFLTQRRMMFPAPILFDDRASPPPGGKRIWLETMAGRSEAWYLPPTRGTTSPSPLLIFAHGNAELIDDWSDAFDEPRRWGLAVLLVEYPGYGRSGGKPSEASIQMSFVAAYDDVVENRLADPNRIVGYGRSVGGGAITGLSRQRPLAAMILESTFTSTKPFARRFGAPAFLVRDSFDNESAVRQYDGPLLIVHGTRDDIIPVEHGRALAQVSGARLHELPCGHNDCGRDWPTVKDFLIEARVLELMTSR